MLATCGMIRQLSPLLSEGRTTDHRTWASGRRESGRPVTVAPDPNLFSRCLDFSDDDRASSVNRHLVAVVEEANSGISSGRGFAIL